MQCGKQNAGVDIVLVSIYLLALLNYFAKRFANMAILYEAKMITHSTTQIPLGK